MQDAEELVERHKVETGRYLDTNRTVELIQRSIAAMPDWLNDLPNPLPGHIPCDETEWWSLARGALNAGEVLLLYARPDAQRTLALIPPGTGSLLPQELSDELADGADVSYGGWRVATWGREQHPETHRARPDDLAFTNFGLIAAVVDRYTHLSRPIESWLERSARHRVWHLTRMLFRTKSESERAAGWNRERTSLLRDGTARWSARWEQVIDGPCSSAILDGLIESQLHARLTAGENACCDEQLLSNYERFQQQVLDLSEPDVDDV